MLTAKHDFLYKDGCTQRQLKLIFKRPRICPGSRVEQLKQS